MAVATSVECCVRLSVLLNLVSCGRGMTAMIDGCSVGTLKEHKKRRSKLN